MTAITDIKNNRRDKRTLRKKLHEVRGQLTDDQVRDFSRSIRKHLNDLSEFQEAEVIHLYLSIEERNEVDTLPIASQLIQEDRTVLVPITQFVDHSLKHVRLERIDNLVVNKWHVPEPPEPHNDFVSFEDIDIVLVPMLGGDASGNRVGYGKGYYDRFLKQVSGTKIGLLFDCCLVDNVPAEDHDVALDYIITEQRVIKPNH